MVGTAAVGVLRFDAGGQAVKLPVDGYRCVEVDQPGLHFFERGFAARDEDVCWVSAQELRLEPGGVQLLVEGSNGRRVVGRPISGVAMGYSCEDRLEIGGRDRFYRAPDDRV